MSTEYDEKAFKYIRFGHLDTGTKTDSFVKLATELLPSLGELPKRWSYESRESFLERFPECSNVVWSKTASYHLLILNGYRVLRIWTDSSTTAVVDLDYKLADALKGTFDIFDAPESTWRKTKPFRKRMRLESETQVKILIAQALLTYGVMT